MFRLRVSILSWSERPGEAGPRRGTSLVALHVCWCARMERDGLGCVDAGGRRIGTVRWRGVVQRGPSIQEIHERRGAYRAGSFVWTAPIQWERERPRVWRRGMPPFPFRWGDVSRRTTPRVGSAPKIHRSSRIVTCSLSSSAGQVVPSDPRGRRGFPHPNVVIEAVPFSIPSRPFVSRSHDLLRQSKRSRWKISSRGERTRFGSCFGCRFGTSSNRTTKHEQTHRLLLHTHRHRRIRRTRDVCRSRGTGRSRPEAEACDETSADVQPERRFVPLVQEVQTPPRQNKDPSPSIEDWNTNPDEVRVC